MKKLAEISALSQSRRTMPVSAREPNASESASINIDLPAPVSPVSTVKPRSNSSSSASTIIKLRIFNVCNMLPVNPSVIFRATYQSGYALADATR